MLEIIGEAVKKAKEMYDVKIQWDESSLIKRYIENYTIIRYFWVSLRIPERNRKKIYLGGRWIFYDAKIRRILHFESIIRISFPIRN